ncbi:Protein kinase family protein [Rhynchospora pubera]|uniref:Protein kinase family protein n=1 Tax=Rhynchospora pubera TaxID=906938 RepID=A0AAV8H553_9POAL|nr:Protein kinase family protein [Rhynchospora pubera]
MSFDSSNLDMSNFGTDNSDNFESSFNALVAVSIVLPLISVIATVVIVITVYKYCKKHGLPAININTHNQYTGPPAATPLYTTVADSQLKMATIENFLNEIAREKPIRFFPEQLAGFTHNYLTKLGSGGFGAVYKGKLPNGMAVAVKVLHGNLDKRVEEQFMAEVGTIGRTHHINLVRLFGFCFDSTIRALVYEYMDNGALDTLLFRNSNMAGGGVSFPMLHEIAVGTAKGIRENTHVSMTGIRGTPGYAAPEMWMGIGVTEACDVYSFGMLLFEIVGRRKNFVEASNGNSSDSHQWLPRIVWERYNRGLLAELVVVTHGMMDEEERTKAERMCKVALWCVQYQPNARPSMGKVVKMLEGEMDISAPVNPFQHLMVPIVDMGSWGESSTSSSDSNGEIRNI